MNKAMLTLITMTGITIGALAIAGTAGSGNSSESAPQTGSFTGYVTDLKCKRAVDADCNRKCLGLGEQPALLLDGSNEVVRLKNAEEAKKYPGAHVEVKGTRSDDGIAVSSIKAAR